MRYQHLLIDNSSPPATNIELQAIEKALGCALPQDYKSFLQASNGGFLEYEVLAEYPDDTSEYVLLGSFYKASDEREGNPTQLLEERAYKNLPQSKVLPIARDGGSSVLYLDLRDGYQVVANMAALPAWTGHRSENQLVVLAESFDAYLQKMTLSDETIACHIQEMLLTDEVVAMTLAWFESVRPDWQDHFQEQWDAKMALRSKPDLLY